MVVGRSSFVIVCLLLPGGEENRLHEDERAISGEADEVRCEAARGEEVGFVGSRFHAPRFERIAVTDGGFAMHRETSGDGERARFRAHEGKFNRETIGGAFHAVAA